MWVCVCVCGCVCVYVCVCVCSVSVFLCCVDSYSVLIEPSRSEAFYFLSSVFGAEKVEHTIFLGDVWAKRYLDTPFVCQEEKAEQKNGKASKKANGKAGKKAEQNNGKAGKKAEQNNGKAGKAEQNNGKAGKKAEQQNGKVGKKNEEKHRVVMKRPCQVGMGYVVGTQSCASKKA